MGQFYSGADLKKAALQRAGEPTDGTSQYDALAMSYVNELYFDIIAGSNEFDVDTGDVWIWAKAPSSLILTLQPEYITGTISVIQGSVAVSFSVAPATSMVNQYLAIDDGSNSERYQIVSHTATQKSFTLDGPYNGSTNATTNFRILQIVYPLLPEKQIMRLVEPMRGYKTSFDEDLNYQCYGIDSSSFNKDYPLASIVSGVPTRFFWFKDDDDIIQVRFNQVPSELTRFEVDYIPMPDEITDSDQSVPVIPRPFRVALVYGAAYHLLQDKNDDRAPTYFQMAKNKIMALREAARKEQSHVNTKSKGVIFARQEFIRVRQRLQLFVRQGYYG